MRRGRHQTPAAGLVQGYRTQIESFQTNNFSRLNDNQVKSHCRFLRLGNLIWNIQFLFHQPHMASTTFLFFYYYKYLWPQNIRLKLCWIMRRYLNWMFYKPPKTPQKRNVWFWLVLAGFFDFSLWFPLWNNENKSCLNELKFWEVSQNPKRSKFWKCQLSILCGIQKSAKIHKTVGKVCNLVLLSHGLWI